MNDCTVVKVGGSLFDLLDLRERLLGFFATLDAEKIGIIPGGGATADAIRALDRIHQLGEETSHWLAIQALSVNARFLGELLGVGLVSSYASFADASGSDERILVLDPLPIFAADETNADHLPHTWSVTSDSLAARAAILFQARELILLKSVAWRGVDWRQAMDAQIVDAFFARALACAAPSLRVRIVNLRASRGPVTE